MADEIGSLLVSIGADIKGLKAATAKVNAEVGKMSTGVKKEATGIQKAFKGIGPAIIGAFSAGAVFGAVKGAIKTISEFEDAMAGLKSITAASDADMKKFGAAAIDLSKDFGSSASSIVEGFQLVKSAMAELSTDEVIEVTKQADILSKAIGIDASAAANTLTLAMNQFGASADEAANFVDILATSQQKGTALATQIADAMVNAGATAKSFGLSFEETNVLLQGFAKGGTVGAEAGTQLAGILSKLAKTTKKEFNPTQTNAIEVIDNLSKAQLSYTDLVKLTDTEGAKWLSTLIAQNGQVQTLANDGLLQVGNALDQAKTNTDTLSAATEKLGANWDAFVLSIESGSGPISEAMKSFVNGISEGLAQTQKIQNSEFVPWWLKLANVVAPGTEAISETVHEVQALNQAIQDVSTREGLTDIMKSIALEMNKAKKQFNEGEISLEQFRQRMSNLREMSSAAAENFKKNRVAVKDLAEETTDAGDAAKKAGEEAKKSAPKWEKMTKAVTSSLMETKKLPANAKTAIADLSKELEKAPQLMKPVEILTTASLSDEAPSKLQKELETLGMDLKLAAITFAPAIGQMAKQFGENMLSNMKQAVTQLAGVFTSQMTAFGGSFEALIQGDVAGAVIGVFGDFSQASSNAAQRLEEIAESGEKVSDEEMKRLQEAAQFNELINRINSALQDVITSLMPAFNAMISGFEPLVGILPQIASLLSELMISAIKPMIKPVISLLKMFTIIARALQPIIEAFDVFRGALAEIVVSAIEPLIPLFVRLASMVTKLTPALTLIIDLLANVLAPIIAIYAAEFLLLIEVMEPLINMIARDLLPALLEITDAVLPVLSEALMFIAGIITTIAVAWRDLGEFLDGIIGKIEQIFDTFNSWIENLPLFGGGSGGGGGGGGGSGGGGGFLSGIGNAIGGLLGLADGGIVTSPTLAMIAEAGEPEAVIPLSKLGNMGGGSVVFEIAGDTLRGVLDRHDESSQFS